MTAQLLATVCRWTGAVSAFLFRLTFTEGLTSRRLTMRDEWLAQRVWVPPPARTERDEKRSALIDTAGRKLIVAVPDRYGRAESKRCRQDKRRSIQRRTFARATWSSRSATRGAFTSRLASLDATGDRVVQGAP